jgi:hypothetical protein
MAGDTFFVEDGFHLGIEINRSRMGAPDKKDSQQRERCYHRNSFLLFGDAHVACKLSAVPALNLNNLPVIPACFWENLAALLLQLFEKPISGHKRGGTMLYRLQNKPQEKVYGLILISLIFACLAACSTWA